MPPSPFPSLARRYDPNTQYGPQGELSILEPDDFRYLKCALFRGVTLFPRIRDEAELIGRCWQVRRRGVHHRHAV